MVGWRGGNEAPLVADFDGTGEAEGSSRVNPLAVITKADLRWGLAVALVGRHDRLQGWGSRGEGRAGGEGGREGFRSHYVAPRRGKLFETKACRPRPFNFSALNSHLGGRLPSLINNRESVRLWLDGFERR